MRRRFLLAGISVVAMSAISAPAWAGPQQLWAKTYATSGQCGLTAKSSAVDPSNGNEYAAFEDFACGVRGNLVVAYTHTGTRKWAVEDESHDDNPAGLAVDAATHRVIVASTRNGNEMLAQAFDPSTGRVLWSRGIVASGDASFETTGVVIDAHGRVIVTGTVTRNGVPEFSTRAFSVAHGTVLWNFHFAGVEGMGATATGIGVDASENRVYVGGTDFDGHGNRLVTVAYSSASGHAAWTTEDPTVNTTSITVGVDAGNHQVYAVSYDGSGNNGVRAYSDAGALQWFRAITTGGFGTHDVAVDAKNHQLYLAGPAGANFRTEIIAYSAAGTRLWADTDTSADQSFTTGVVADTTNHRVYVTSTVGPTAPTSVVTFADSATGTRAWHEIYSASGTTSGAGAICVDEGRAQVYVAGYQADTSQYALTTAEQA